MLWTLKGNEVFVTKATPKSDWRKAMLGKKGTTAIPRHIQRALKLNTSRGEEKVMWILKESQIVAVMNDKHAQNSWDHQHQLPR